MDKVFCPKCNRKVDYRLKENIIEKFKGKIVNVVEKVAVCDECGEDIFVPQIEQENFTVLYEKYREVSNLIKPEELIKFREKYNISQRELVSILGWGKMTINRYERGGLPSTGHSDYLKLIFKDENIFKEVVEKAYKETSITMKCYEKITGSINNYIDELQFRLLNSKLNCKQSIYNGFGKFNLDKIENIISYIADNVDNLYKTSLNKYLFYIDFLCYKENSVSITGLRYVKEQFGPVIEQKGYEDIINLLNDKVEKIERFGYEYSIITKINSKKNYNMSLIKDYEIDVINTVINKLNAMNCTEISNLSHEEDAWKDTAKGELITYDFAESLLM
ncbi:MAG: type II TA system antitoxin MqsA family protein [Clostridium sp.]